MHWFVLKSGMPMYDLERAYGLGLIVKQLTDEEVRVYDKALYYQIETPATSLREGKSNLDKILSLVAEDLDAWNRVLRTTLRKDRPGKSHRLCHWQTKCPLLHEECWSERGLRCPDDDPLPDHHRFVGHRGLR